MTDGSDRLLPLTRALLVTGTAAGVGQEPYRPTS
jgi:hypothetical protein